MQFTDSLMAEELFRLALEYDPAYSDAYVNLGWNYYFRYQNTVQYQPACLDSVRKYVDLAIACDDQYDRAYILRGYYHRMLGEEDMAEVDYNRALELNPNSAGAYNGKAWMAWEKNDILEAIRNFHHAVNLDRGPSLSAGYYRLSQAYLLAGFKEQSVHYSEKALELSGDRPSYYLALANTEFWISKDLDKAQEYLHKGYAIDSTNVAILHAMGYFYLCAGAYDISLDYFKKYENQFDSPGNIPSYMKNHIALSYLKNGYPGVAEEYFEQQIDYLQNRLALEKSSYDHHILLAQIYALKRVKEKVYEHLKAFNQSEYTDIYTSRESLEHNLYFGEFLDDAEFNQLMSEIESKYEALHERVWRWLEEND